MMFVITAIILMGLVTYAVRLLPFYGLKLVQNLQVIDYLSELLPVAILTVLVIFSFHLVPNFLSTTTFIKALCLVLVVLVQLTWRSAATSMILGLGCYIILGFLF